MDYSEVWTPDARRLSLLCARLKGTRDAEREVIEAEIVDEMLAAWVFEYRGVKLRERLRAWIRVGMDARAREWFAEVGFTHGARGRPNERVLGKFVQRQM